METANKNAALQWLSKARLALKEGRRDDARRLVNKSLKLCATEPAKDFLNELENSSNTGSSKPTPPSGSIPRPKEPPSEARDNKQETSQENNYTPEQVKAVKRVLGCRDYYDILEVSKTATEVEIKKQYKRLALQLHPDKNNAPKADDAFKAVSKAYAVLSDKDKRNDYDRFGEDGLRETNAYSDSDFDPDQMFRMFFGDSFFGNGFGPTYTVHRDPFGRTVYRRRQNASRYSHSHRAHPNAAREPESAMAMLCQLMPILMILIIVIFGNVLTGILPSAPFSLYKTSSYTVKRFVPDYHIPYYVQKSFARDDKNYVNSVEKDVINEYMWNLNQQCTSDKYIQRKRGKKVIPDSCNKLEELRKKLRERSR